MMMTPSPPPPPPGIDERLGTLMVAFFGSDIGKTNFVGVCIGVADHPTILFEAEPKSPCQARWAAHLCRPATKDEQIEYWKKRALADG